MVARHELRFAYNRNDPLRPFADFGADRLLRPVACAHLLKLGGQAGNDRYAMVDQSNTVVVLPGTLVQRLTAPPLQFRDRNIARAVGIDRISLQRGPRNAVFARTDGLWKMVEPIEAEAEQADLDDFISQLAEVRAEQLAAEKPADLKAYGLDRPLPERMAEWYGRVLHGDLGRSAITQVPVMESIIDRLPSKR